LTADVPNWILAAETDPPDQKKPSALWPTRYVGVLICPSPLGAVIHGKQNQHATEDPERTRETTRRFCRRLLELDSHRASQVLGFMVYATFAAWKPGCKNIACVSDMVGGRFKEIAM